MIPFLLFLIFCGWLYRQFTLQRNRHRWEYRFVTLVWFAKYFAADAKAVWASVPLRRHRPR